MADSNIDWTDNAFLTLDEAAKLLPGADRDTLKRLARRGILTVYKPGKAYMTTAVDVRDAMIKCRVVPKGRSQPTSETPNSLGLTEMDLANMALDRALAQPRRPAKDARQLSDKAEHAHRLEMKERRKARARAKYRQKVERAKDEPK
jgi:hypothetical protein